MRCCGVVNDSAFSSRVSADIAKLVSDGAQLSVSSTIQIQVIFHICYNGVVSSADINADIEWSLQQMNADFNALASNKNQFDTVFSNDLLATYNDYKSRMGAMNVNFVKSQVVYNAAPAQSSTNTSVLDSSIKARSPAINPETSLNIWIADLTSNILGYAQFPWDFSPATKMYDGVLIARSVFGRNAPDTKFNLNKTMTHEVGHWFGLYHTFQSTFAYTGGNIDYAPGTNPEETKGDCVIDTPPQRNPTFGNPFNTPLSWPTSQPTDESQPYRAMFFNFMDYVDDVSMFMYTTDQVNKMRLMVQIYRPGIVSSSLPPPPPPVYPAAPTPPYYITNFTTGSDNTLWKGSPAAAVKVLNNLLTLQNVSSATRSLSVSNLQGYVTSLRTTVTYRSTGAAALQVKPPDKNVFTSLVLQPSSSWRTVSIRVAVKNFRSGMFTLLFQVNVKNRKLEVQQVKVE